MNWIKTSDGGYRKKPGIKRYEQIPCLVVKQGRRGHVELLVWNCEHLCWDDSEGVCIPGYKQIDRHKYIVLSI